MTTLSTIRTSWPHRCATLLAALLALPSAALAHHSRFVYDTSELVEVRGTIESVFWRNPHVMISVRGTGESGQPGESGEEAVYQLEAGPVNAFERAGIFEDAVIVGAPVTVLGFASQRDEHDMQPVRLDYGNGRNVVLSDEWAVRLGMLDEAHERAAIDPEQVARAIEEADGLFRVWVNTGRTYIDRNLPLRPAAQAAKDAWDQPSDDVALRCDPAGLPEAMVSPFPVELVDNGDTITVRLEEWDNVRTIYMNPETAPADPEPSRLGHSVGRWEGDELVVTTDRLNYLFLDDRGTPQSEAVEIVERFVMSEDETRMDWHATLVDDNTFTAPVRLPIMHYEWVPGEQIKVYDCTVSE